MIQATLVSCRSTSTVTSSPRQENYSYTGDEVMDSYELTEAGGEHLVYTDDHHTARRTW